MKLIYFFAVLSALSPAAQGQQLDSILKVVRLNNKTIKVFEAENQAIKVGSDIGLYPENPTVEYDVLYGKPAGAGIQKDFAITQRFDFPTAYGHRNTLSKARKRQMEFVSKGKIQEIMLEVKLDWLKWIHLNQLISMCELKTAIFSKLYLAYQKRMNAGEGNILELNRLRLSLLKSTSQLTEHIQLRRQLRQDFVRHTGGLSIDVNTSLYPPLGEIPSFDVLDSVIEANDPMLSGYNEEKTIARKEVALSRALAMPMIETGYHSQAILGQKYQGIHFGLSIPLWEKKNTIKHKKLLERVTESQIEDHLVEHRQENQLAHQHYLDATQLLNEYEMILKQLNSEALLDKALKYGEISMIQYYEQLYELYEARETVLEYNYKQQEAIARLLKYTL